MRREISRNIKEWKDEAGVDSIILVGRYSDISRTITICTNKPGVMIGKGGALVNKYIDKLKVINPDLESIKFVETDDWYIK